mgnify:CR=1 FL=1
MVKIAASILSADFARLGQQVTEVEAAGVDYIHVDVMDGHFVPNITAGPMIVEAVRRVTDLPIDVHLMIEKPEKYLPHFAAAGATILTVHVEPCPHLHRTVQQIHELGAKAGVTLNPATSLFTLEEILPYVDLVLLMTVNPGFGGQQFISTSLSRIERLRRMLDQAGYPAELEVDGGVNPETAPQIVAAGATILVSGAAIFESELSIREAVARLRGSYSHFSVAA